MIKINPELKKRFLTFEEAKMLVISTLKRGRAIEILNKIINEKYILRKFFCHLKIQNKLRLIKKEYFPISICKIEKTIKCKLSKIFSELRNYSKNSTYFISNCKNFKDFKKIYGVFKLEKALKSYTHKLLFTFISKCLILRDINFSKTDKNEIREIINNFKSFKKNDIFLYNFNYNIRKSNTYYKYINDKLPKKTSNNNINFNHKVFDFLLHNNIKTKKKEKKYSLENFYDEYPLKPYYYEELPSIKLSHNFDLFIKDSYQNDNENILPYIKYLLYIKDEYNNYGFFEEIL
ncbi:conserved Plasmodium protein, unknown function [Plasmodium gallinaceum]|uniref:Uncharacterized protein n=1 Tax=Plasmodium gallinaceum TaxID=5849 RepID=A0A1J1GS30_PLAGA|nr:conserved Plasmodium protein, unknown function [Plasmodium gallinaceum]CRG94112.1 conserved Plasmodium protein, unknown function [Plasmodium gallinaceum]